MSEDGIDAETDSAETNDDRTDRGGTKDDQTASGVSSVRRSLTRLATFRESDRERRFLTLAGLVVGLLVALVHWFGFVLGGALVSLPQVSIRRGVLAGLGFGVFAWLGFLVTLGTAGVLDTYVQMTPILAVSTATPILGGLFGSLIRGVV